MSDEDLVECPIHGTQSTAWHCPKCCAETRKDLADARAAAMPVEALRAEIAAADKERMALESRLFDAMATLSFYAAARNYEDGVPHPDGHMATSVAVDNGKRARVTLRKIAEAAEAFVKDAGKVRG